jgi:hypothetical protein
VTDRLVQAYIWQRTARDAVWARITLDEGGEGVISAAIAVLVMAFLGALMWAGFKLTLGHAQSHVDTQVDQIGR